jgi:hypothetical protein
MIQNNHDAVDEQVGISIFKILLQVTRPKTGSGKHTWDRYIP